MNVVILEDAAEDLESGAQFYESCATGVGDYFFSVAYHLLARDNEYKNQAEDNRRRWKTIADGGFELYVIPGRHDTIREEPYVSYLAQKLTACLESTYKDDFRYKRKSVDFLTQRSV